MMVNMKVRARAGAREDADAQMQMQVIRLNGMVWWLAYSSRTRRYLHNALYISRSV